MEKGVTKNPKKVKAGKRGYQARLLEPEGNTKLVPPLLLPDWYYWHHHCYHCWYYWYLATGTSTKNTDVYMYGVGSLSNYSSWIMYFLHL